MISTLIIRIILSFASALLLILCFPKFDLEFLAWIGLVPLFCVIKDRGLKSAFTLSFITGIVFFMGTFYWINIIKGFTYYDFLILGIYLGSYFGIFGLLLNYVSKKISLSRVFIAPVIWVSIEYFRSHADFLALPWALLGHSQYLNLPIIQIASFTGVYGVSFLIVMINAALSEIILYLCDRRGKNSPIKSRIIFGSSAAALLLVILSFLYGYDVISEQTRTDKVTVSVIQGNIPQGQKWKREFLKQNLEKHILLTQEAANSGSTSLIVWPEASLQGFLTQDLYLFQTISKLAKEARTYLLIGSSQRPKFGAREFRKGHWFNTAFFVTPLGRIEKQYNKIKLLPFGEYLPHADMLPWPSRFIPENGTFIPGKEYTIFNINGTKFGVLICWENIFPDLFRNTVKSGAEFMVNITNEAWFGETAAPYQFVSMSVFRAVENHVSIARAANTGISCFIDPFGRLIGKVTENSKDIFVEGYLTKEIPITHRKTFYTLYGDFFAFINLTVTALILGLALLKNRKNNRRQSL